MSYTVLARRYRSQSFGELVGQGSVGGTLLTAIQTDRVAHAYLFTGTRGVGKTSMARLLARALNAPDSLKEAPRPEGVPHDRWPSVEVQQRMADGIMRGDDLNVIEIDGASHNGVEQARELIASAHLAPSSGAPYRIYIIDEVHMLTQAAFNALLKTMEEPPEHVKFILCTTEAHKIPVTIASRCQKFTFRNISVQQVQDHLEAICKQENIEADEDVLNRVAHLGAGSMRDALSLLDRLLAAGYKKIDSRLLEELLGLPPQDGIYALLGKMSVGDVGEVLALADRLLREGLAIEPLVDTLISCFRDLMIVVACGPDTKVLEVSEDARAQLRFLAGSYDAPALAWAVTLCENLRRQMRESVSPRALFDAAVVRLTLAPKMADLPALMTEWSKKAQG